MSEAPDRTYEILVPIYPHVNTLDVNGPLEVLCNYALRSKGKTPFHVTITAIEKEVQAYEFITLKPDIVFEAPEGTESAIANIKKGKYDILLVPGSTSTGIDALIKTNINEKTGDFDLVKNAPILKVIRAFIEHDTAKGLEDMGCGEQMKTNKWLFSVCTGNLLVGAAGAFAGLDATTHWAALQALGTICEKADAKAKSVTRKRWIEAADIPPAKGQRVPTRVLSAGGISCALDGSLWLVKQVLGKSSAFAVGEMMDYNWNIKEYTTTEPQVI